MEKTTISNLKKGEFFTLKPIENPTESQVYISGEYDRSDRKYEATKFSDISASRYLKHTTKVYTEFTF